MLAQFGQLLRAITAGPDPARLPAPQELIATFDVDGRPEYDYPKDVRRYCGYAIETGAASNRSMVQLFNPGGSQTMAVIDAVHAIGESSALVLTSYYAAMDDDGTEWATDDRARVGRSSSCKVQSRTYTSQLGDAMTRIFATAGLGSVYFFHHHEPLVLMPGRSFVVCGSADDTYVQCSFFWRERAFDPEEIRGIPPTVYA